MPKPLVSVVIINFNGARFLEELFESIETQDFRDFEIVLIDNDSKDNSVAYARRRCPQARILPQTSNLGFSRAGNLGVQEAAGQLVAFLNTDMRLDPSWLGELVGQIATAPDLGAVASKIRLYHSPTVLNGVGGEMNVLGYTWDRGMFEEDEGQFDTAAEVLFASAGSALFRRTSFLAAGGFDERFFMYHEDVDLGWRLWLQGERILTAPRSIAYHHFGGTTQKVQGQMWRELMGERNNMRTLLKNYDRSTLTRVFPRLLLLKQPPSRKWGQLRNLSWNLRCLPDTLKERRRIQQSRVRRDSELTRLIRQSIEIPVDLSPLTRLHNRTGDSHQ